MKRTVRIKTWEEMCEVGTLDASNDIESPDDTNTFVDLMEEEMPKDRIVEIENKKWDAPKTGDWVIEEWMIAEEIS